MAVMHSPYASLLLRPVYCTVQYNMERLIATREPQFRVVRRTGRMECCRYREFKRRIAQIIFACIQDGKMER